MKYALYPSGIHYSSVRKIAEKYADMELEFIIDDSKCGTCFDGVDVAGLDDVSDRIKRENICVIVNSDTYAEAITENLRKKGITNHTHYKDFIVTTLDRIAENMAKGKKGSIGIYFQHNMYRRHLGDIPFRLKEMGYGVTVFSEVDSKDRYSEEFHFIAPIEGWMVENLKNIDVFITTDMFTKLPKASRRVHFPHGMFTFESFVSTDLVDKDNRANIPRFTEIFEGFDYIACMRPSTIRLLETVSDYTRREKSTLLIPCGYPSVDINLKATSDISDGRDSVLYAPAGKYVPGSSTFADYTSFPKYSADILNELARIFEDKRIIFRPHPGSLKDASEHIARIMEETALSGRVVLDSGNNSQKEAMSRSVLTVTDHSSTGYNFALTQLRPVVFFQRGNPDITAFVGETAFTDAYFRFRNEVGVVVSSVNELKQGIESAFRRFDEKHIMEFRENFFFNPGKSEDYFIENFESIIKGINSSGWKMV